jgi:hypothetical protein
MNLLCSAALILAAGLHAQEATPPAAPAPAPAAQATPAPAAKPAPVPPAAKPLTLKAKAQRAAAKEETARKALDQAQQERAKAELVAAQADLKLRLEHLDAADAAFKKAREQAKLAWTEAQAAKAALARVEGRKASHHRAKNPYIR